jgi:arginase
MRVPAIVEAPSVLGLRPSGVQDLPRALLDAGLADLPRSVRAGRVEPPPYDRRRDPETGVLNAAGIAEYSSSSSFILSSRSCASCVVLSS